jgi:hypothetical protein
MIERRTEEKGTREEKVIGEKKNRMNGGKI